MGSGTVDVVIAGVSTRAFAESAVRAGYACASVDAFGDLDQQAVVANVGIRRDLGRRYTAAAAAHASRRFDAARAAYVGNFENHPAAVRRLAEHRQLLGNPPEVLVRARDFRQLARVVTAAGGAVPLTLSSATVAQVFGGRGNSWMGQAGAPRIQGRQTSRATPWPDGTEWLRKPVRGGGGSGVQPWQPGTPIGRRAMVQERIEGLLASAVFVSDGRRARVLGLSQQLAGDHAFCAPGFRYAGSLFPLALPEARSTLVRERVTVIADALTAAFGLRGVNGIDLVIASDTVFVLELNPRYPASAELIERATGLSVFTAHAASCVEGVLAAPTAPAFGVWGKAIVYARRDVVVGDTRAWLGRDDVRDIPHPCERISRGAPVCTVLARGDDADDCRDRLTALASEVYRQIEGSDVGGPAH